MPRPLKSVGSCRRSWRSARVIQHSASASRIESAASSASLARRMHSRSTASESRPADRSSSADSRTNAAARCSTSESRRPATSSRRIASDRAFSTATGAPRRLPESAAGNTVLVMGALAGDG